MKKKIVTTTIIYFKKNILKEDLNLICKKLVVKLVMIHKKIKKIKINIVIQI